MKNCDCVKADVGKKRVDEESVKKLSEVSVGGCCAGMNLVEELRLE